MNLVIDTNVIISALLKDSKCREIIVSGKFNLFTPAFTLTEIEKYKGEICKKAKISIPDFDELLKIIFKYIAIINPESYKKHLDYGKGLISDIKDVPFIASALSLGLGIWSDDKGFKEQGIVKTFSTREIINFLG